MVGARWLGGIAVVLAMSGCAPAVYVAGAALANATPDACGNADGALTGAAFVIATEPRAGARVRSGFEVAGCSRTFERTVRWRLLARDGSVLASGHTTGGGMDRPDAFRFTVAYRVVGRQIGHLEVFEDDASDGEGFPPGRTVLPVVLSPS